MDDILLVTATLYSILVSTNSAVVSWTVDTTINPQFKQDVRLNCTVTGVTSCCTDETREWGITINGVRDPILVDGIPTVPNGKYKEELQGSSSQFNLVITNFSLSDFEKMYDCSYGFDNDQKILKNNITYFPDQDDIKIITKSFTSSGVFFVANISTVNPAPTACSVTYGGSDVSSSLRNISSPNGALWSFFLTMSLATHACEPTFTVQCTIGPFTKNIIELVTGCHPTTADSTTKQQSPPNSDQYTSANIKETTFTVTGSTRADVAMYTATTSVIGITDIPSTYSQVLLTQNEDQKYIIIIVVSCVVFAIVLIVVSFLVLRLGKSRASCKGDNKKQINKSETRQISYRGQWQSDQNERSLPLYNYSMHQYRPKIFTKTYNVGFGEYDGNTKTSERSKPHYVDLPDQYQLSSTTYQMYRSRNKYYNRNTQFELRPTNTLVQGDFQAFQGYFQNQRQPRTQKQSYADNRNNSRASYSWQ